MSNQAQSLMPQIVAIITEKFKDTFFSKSDESFVASVDYGIALVELGVYYLIGRVSASISHFCPHFLSEDGDGEDYNDYQCLFVAKFNRFNRQLDSVVFGDCRTTSISGIGRRIWFDNRGIDNVIGAVKRGNDIMIYYSNYGEEKSEVISIPVKESNISDYDDHNFEPVEQDAD